MSQFNIVQATRQKVYTKIALMGASGSGKTYSALRLAKGMLEELKALGLKPENKGIEKNGRILMANTEASRGRYYANEFDYDIIDVTAPHSPEMYVDLINYVVAQNYPILILDSTSPEWEGSGGCLELHQKMGGNFQAWAKVTPRHDKFIHAIADSEIHVIATMRGKDQYEVTGENNKPTVKKLGVGAKQRDGFEYEFTATFTIDNATATPQKDNTHIFEAQSFLQLTENHGVQIIKWANSGEGFTPVAREAKAVVESNDLTQLKAEVVELMKAGGGLKNEALMSKVKEFVPSGNPNSIRDVTKLQELKNALVEMAEAVPAE